MLAALVALPTTVFVAVGLVGELGLGVRSLVGVVVFAAIYGVVIVALGPTTAPYADGWRMSRRVRRVVIVVAALGGLVAALPLVGV